MTPTSPPNEIASASALEDLTAAVRKLIEVTDRQGSGVREELVRIEEAIRDAAPLGPRGIL
jgi:hypothetical protein